MTTRSSAGRLRRAWTRATDERLLRERIGDLDLRVERTWLAGCVERLADELERRGIGFRPHVWLSNEWFSPDGIPGIAIPFFLAHPRLIRLEQTMMLEAEGSNEPSCMRLLRHEAGHAIDTAYRLHFRKSWRETFGRYSQPYPDVYRPNPASRRHVLHLDSWYAQAHPAEDFAETFAVWLRPRSDWRQRYREWPVALRKLNTVHEMMQDHVVGRAPRVRSRRRVEPVGSLRETLGEFYRRKRERYGAHWSDFYDRDLRRVFSDEPRHRRHPSAAGFLRRMRVEARTAVAEWTGAHPYTVDQVAREIIERCRELRLRLRDGETRARTDALLMLTVHVMNCQHVRRQEIPL